MAVVPIVNPEPPEPQPPVNRGEPFHPDPYERRDHVPVTPTVTTEGKPRTEAATETLETRGRRDVEAAPPDTRQTSARGQNTAAEPFYVRPPRGPERWNQRKAARAHT